VAVDPPKDEDGKGFRKQVSIKTLRDSLQNPDTQLLS